MVQIVERVSYELPSIYWVGWFMFVHSEKKTKTFDTWLLTVSILESLAETFSTELSLEKEKRLPRRLLRGVPTGWVSAGGGRILPVTGDSCGVSHM